MRNPAERVHPPHGARILSRAVRGSTGLIFDIQRFSLHDGHGIRTLVFMKGCPLVCAWCSNPESQKRRPEIMFFQEKCLDCRACLGACPNAALLEEVFPRTPSACLGCGRCVEVCYAEARHLVGRSVSVADVMKVIRSDREFYQQGGGGVTVGGGEPLLQHRFVAELLARCRGEGMHTALETSGFSPWKNFESVLRHVNQLLFDIKHMDPARHRELTGVDNSLILKNARKAAGRVGEMVIRMPLIPGCNNDVGNLHELGRFVKEELSSGRGGSLDEKRSAGLPGNPCVLWPGGSYKLNKLKKLLARFLLVLYYQIN
ncbi:MAG: glycyl-radical enzyme activating protein [Spirochaetia bacterium]